MKKIVLPAILLCLCCAGILAVWLPGYFTETRKKTVYIALAGPMSGFAQEEGKAMLRGATLAYEQVKREGKLLKDKKVEILPYDDRNSQTAVRIAADIVEENKVLLVLGHYSNSGSAAAGPMYQSNGIPAITASATKEAATQENEWFFRTIPGMRSMTEFAVHSMQELPGVTSKTASIIYDVNFYDTSVAEEFKKKAENIFDNLNSWSFDSKSDSKNNDIKKIIGEIRAEQSVGPIFFATTSKDSGDIISSFRYPGTDYPIIGADSFSVPTFIQQFESYPNEQERPGYYTNGTYAVSPFISYLADKPNALAFRKKFLRHYGKEPSWVAATYYDAMLLALNAVEKAEIQGESIREDRRRVRNALNRLNEKDVAVKGVTGDLYFDEDGNINLPLALGVWWNYEFLPDYQQCRMSDSQGDREEENGEQGLEDTSEPRTTCLKVVYTGVDINVIHNLDLKQGVFTADFYLWFRFKGSFEDRAVKFINAVKPVTLGKPIMEAKNGKNGDIITTRAYRVIADFTVDSSTAAYPLDRHTLPIHFRHAKEARDTMIYIPDLIGMTGSVSKKNRGETMLEKLPSWEISEIVSRQNLETIQGENKKNISYSRIDTEISIHRQGRGMLLGKILLPFLYIIVLIYLLFCIAPERIWTRIFIQLYLLFLTVAIRILYKYIFSGQEITQYMFYFVVALLFFSVLIFGGSYWTHRYKYIRTATCIHYTGKFLYLAATTAGIIFLLYSHSYLPWSSQTDSSVTQSESVVWLADKIKEIKGALLR